MPVLALALADGIVATTARSLASAMRTDILKPHDLLPEGNAVATFGFSAAFMAGPVIGGAVVAAGGTIAALLVNCGLFAGMALILSVTQLPGAAATAGPVRGRLRERPRTTPGTTWCLKRLLLMQALGLACFTISIPVEVVFAQHTLHAGAGGYGALLGVSGGGAVAGSAVYARWRRRSAADLIAGSAAGAGASGSRRWRWPRRSPLPWSAPPSAVPATALNRSPRGRRSRSERQAAGWR